jgi:hypothetical protein
MNFYLFEQIKFCNLETFIPLFFFAAALQALLLVDSSENEKLS